MESQPAISLLRNQFALAHHWVEGTMQDVSPELAHQHQAGKAHPIGAEYVHVVTAEDYFIHVILGGGAPLMASSYAGKTGFDQMPPAGDWSDWARQVKVDFEPFRQYAQAVYAATDAYLAGLSDADLARPVDLSVLNLGQQNVGFTLSIILLNAAAHAGEISALKGVNGLRGYPF
ncbi:MAG TPA: DinB family protein [Caldilineaceae bacterium]|nr:DinB family protein [Caldilineaceae bacterium]